MQNATQGAVPPKHVSHIVGATGVCSATAGCAAFTTGFAWSAACGATAAAAGVCGAAVIGAGRLACRDGA